MKYKKYRLPTYHDSTVYKPHPSVAFFFVVEDAPQKLYTMEATIPYQAFVKCGRTLTADIIDTIFALGVQEFEKTLRADQLTDGARVEWPDDEETHQLIRSVDPARVEKRVNEWVDLS